MLKPIFLPNFYSHVSFPIFNSNFLAFMMWQLSNLYLWLESRPLLSLLPPRYVFHNCQPASKYCVVVTHSAGWSVQASSFFQLWVIWQHLDVCFVSELMCSEHPHLKQWLYMYCMCVSVSPTISFLLSYVVLLHTYETCPLSVNGTEHCWNHFPVLSPETDSNV